MTLFMWIMYSVALCFGVWHELNGRTNKAVLNVTYAILFYLMATAK